MYSWYKYRYKCYQCLSTIAWLSLGPHPLSINLGHPEHNSGRNSLSLGTPGGNWGGRRRRHEFCHGQCHYWLEPVPEPLRNVVGVPSVPAALTPGEPLAKLV